MNTIKSSFNLMADGLAQQKLVMDTNKVAHLDDRRAKQIKAAGKKIVHRPAELEHFNPDRPEPPKAA